MKTTIVFFEEGKDVTFSKWGKNWERWFISFGILLILHIVYIILNRKRFKKALKGKLNITKVLVMKVKLLLIPDILKVTMLLEQNLITNSQQV